MEIPKHYIKTLEVPAAGIALKDLTLPNNSLKLDTLPETSDLVSGVYEGGLKVWDCSIDLVHYIARNIDIVKGKTILEIGCGQGLPGVLALKLGSTEVCFQDYNPEVLNKATLHVIELNHCSGLTHSLLPGDWLSLCKPNLQHKFKLILMSETLYNLDYYDSLMAFIDFTLAPDGVVIIGTKTYYYGLGGGYVQFQKYL